MLKTSYYANNRKFPEGVEIVSISIYPPKWADFVTTVDKSLAPTKGLLADYKKGDMSWDDYRKRYWKETLSKLDPKVVYERYQGSILLCFEKPEDNCHRDIVREWLEWAGYKSCELGFESTIDFKKLDKKDDDILRLAVIGSRNFIDYETAKKILTMFIKKHENKKIILVSGGAKGADKIAERYAKEFNLEIDIYLPDWDKYGKSAGFKRNYTIWENADMGIAFWDGKSEGTVHSFDISWKQEKELYIYNESLRGFQPRIIKGDVLNYTDRYDMVCFTANSVITSQNNLVMGAGNAKAFRNYFKGIDSDFSIIIKNMSTYGFKVFRRQLENKTIEVGAFQTKVHYGVSGSGSSLELIENSVKKLKTFLDQNPKIQKVALCYPGVSHGGLSKEEVLPLLKGLKVDIFYL